MSDKYNMEFIVSLYTQSWSFNMTPRTWNYVDPELSYDHFSDTNRTIFIMEIKMEKIGFYNSAKIVL